MPRCGRCAERAAGMNLRRLCVLIACGGWEAGPCVSALVRS